MYVLASENIVCVVHCSILFGDLCYQFRIRVAHEWRRITNPVRKFGLELAHDWLIEIKRGNNADINLCLASLILRTSANYTKHSRYLIISHDRFVDKFEERFLLIENFIGSIFFSYLLIYIYINQGLIN